MVALPLQTERAMIQDPARRIPHVIAREIGAQAPQVAAAIDLLDGGATVPFVARYRKEATGGWMTPSCGRWPNA